MIAEELEAYRMGVTVLQEIHIYSHTKDKKEEHTEEFYDILQLGYDKSHSMI